MSYPVKAAISEGVWLHCRGSRFGKDVQLRVRIGDFVRPTGAQLEGLLEDDEVDIEGDLWLLSLEVVNLTREPMTACWPEALLRLQDHEGFTFQALNSNWFRDNRVGFRFRFADTTAVGPLGPKIPSRGVIAFELPDDEAAIYHITIADGSVVPRERQTAALLSPGLVPMDEEEVGDDDNGDDEAEADKLDDDWLYGNK